MKQMKKRAVAAALAMSLAAGNIPGNLVFADQSSHVAQLIAEITANNKVAKPGDVVKVTFYLENASWAKMDSATGLAAGTIDFTYDNTVLTYKESSLVYSDAINTAFSSKQYNNDAEKGTFTVLMMDDSLAKEASFDSNEKTELLHIEFVVKDTLPENLDGAISFQLPQNIDFTFGDMDKDIWVEDSVVSPVIDNKVEFDTTAPTVLLDGSTNTKFFYHPISVDASDRYNIQSVMFNGQEMTKPYTIEQSGTLVVTDANGNQTKLEITVDAAAFDAAKAAIEALPETITFAAKDKVDAAQKAAASVTDETARNKLDLAKLDAAVKAMEALNANREAVVKEIADSNFSITLKADDVKAVQDLRAKVDALQKDGANFTATELKKLTDAETALTELQQRSKKAHDSIAALPSADDTVWSDSAKLEALKKEMTALVALGDTFTDAEQKNIEAVETGLKQITALKTEVEQDILAVLNAGSPSPALATQVGAVNAKLETLNAKGVTNSTIAKYDEFAKVAASIQDMLDKIQAVTDLIQALPTAEKVTFADESALNEAQTARQKLNAEQLDVAPEYIEKLENAQKALDALKADRAALVKEIADSSLSITLKADDIKAIQDLRKKVDTLNEKGANFTATELKKLTDAETALTELQQRSKKAHDAIVALPSADDTVWSDGAKLESLKKEMTALIALGDTFTDAEQDKLAAVEAGIQQITELKAQAEQAIVDVLEAGAPSPALATQVNAVKEQLTALNARGISNDMVEKYEEFAAVAESIQDMLDKIQAVTDLIEALPTAEKVTFATENAINKAQSALEELNAQDLDITAECTQKLLDAQAALKSLKQERADLVEEIANSNLTITLKAEDIKAIQALRTHVNTLNAKEANFTDAELKKLTDAETALAELQQRSKKAHDTIATLPSTDKTIWSYKAIIEDLSKEVTALTNLADSFSDAELQKISDVQKALASIDATANNLRVTMEQLTTNVNNDSITLRDELYKQIQELINVGYAVNDNTMGVTAMERYTAFLLAVQNYEQNKNNESSNNTGTSNESNSSDSSSNSTNTSDSNTSGSSNNSNSSGSNSSATSTSTPVATITPNTVVIKKPTSTATKADASDEKQEPQATATPEATEKPAATEKPSATSDSTSNSASSQQETTPTASKSVFGKLTQVIVGAVVAIGAIAGAAYYWFTKKRD